MPRDPLLRFPSFAAEVRSRLERGRQEYQDASFRRPVSELISEIREELLDVAGWAFIALARLDAIEQAAADVDAGERERR